LQSRKNSSITSIPEEGGTLQRAKSVSVKNSSPEPDPSAPKVATQGALLDRSKSLGSSARSQRMTLRRGDSIAGPVHGPDNSH